MFKTTTITTHFSPAENSQAPIQRGFEKISIKQWCNDFNEYNSGGHPLREELYSELSLPLRATKHSAGYDFFLPLPIVLRPGEEVKIPTGIKVYMLPDEVLEIYPRSSLGFKYTLRLCNTVGIIDSDYYNNANNEGHIWVKIKNEGNVDITLNTGEAFCQGIFKKFLLTDNDMSENCREGGIGSTNERDN